jgi:hypothetical protein
MRMPFSTAVHAHIQSRTASYRRFIVALVTSSMDETTPVCCSTSLTRRWRPVLTGLSTFLNHVETQDAELEERAERIADLEQQLLELQGQAPPEPADPKEIDAMSAIDED